MKPKPIPKDELSLLLAYISGDLSRKGLMKAIGSKSKSDTTGNWWAGSRAIQAIRAEQFVLSKDKK